MNKKGYFRISDGICMSIMVIVTVFVLSPLLIGNGTITINKSFEDSYNNCKVDLAELKSNFEEFKKAKIENVCPKQNSNVFMVGLMYLLGMIMGGILVWSIMNIRKGQEEPKKKRRSK